MTAPSNTQPAIEFDYVSFAINNHPILHDLKLSVRQGETLVLLGRSGSGKTSALKLVNRLVLPTAGIVRVNGRATTEWEPIRLRRSIGYVIQDGGLFPHYTVEKNIGLVPQIENWPKERVQQRVAELLTLVGLAPDLAARYPQELSGGQRQRVGVARALAADPPILLLDEAFGALDPITRSKIQQEFRALQGRMKKAVIFVTHDLREALLLGDRIALLEAGRLIVDLPTSDFVRSREPLVCDYMEAFSAPDKETMA